MQSPRKARSLAASVAESVQVLQRRLPSTSSGHSRTVLQEESRPEHTTDIVERSQQTGVDSEAGGEIAIGYRQTEFNVSEAWVEKEDSLDSIEVPRPWGYALVIHDCNPGRTVWNFLVSILLVYTATVFPYQLCFLEFRIPEPCCQTRGWWWTNAFVDALFWVDLVLNFFFTYEDRNGNEVEDLGQIVCHYLRGYFTLNLIACMPEAVIREVVQVFMGDPNGGSFGRLTRVSRVQRVGRLARLARFAKLVHGFPAVTESALWVWLQNQRGVRVVNFVVGLFLVVHLMGCGWYLCAALHTNPDTTWVASRDAGGVSLIDRRPVDQWLHAMYFILTVFSTVGFGDMSASTNGEIIYVIITMLLGAVVHGIIMSEVINVVTKMDDKAAALSEQKELLAAFAQHTDLDEQTTAEFKQWITRPQKTSKRRYDREAMRKMLVAGHIPRSLVQSLAENIFRGSLLQNKFLKVCMDWAPNRDLPPRFPLLLALASNQHTFQQLEVVYQLHDHPFNVFLVLNGTFACIGMPSPKGGIDCMTTLTHAPANTHGKHARAFQALRGRLQGAYMKGWTSRHSDGVSSQPNTPAGHRTHPIKANKVYPYQLHGAGSYFGDYEILVDPLHKGLNRSRCSTVRCESSNGGQVLVIGSADVLQLAADFPHYGTAWRLVAVRRESTRQILLAQHTRGLDYRQLAAGTIQKYFRSRWRMPNEWVGKRCADILSGLHISAQQSGLSLRDHSGSVGSFAELQSPLPHPPALLPHHLPVAPQAGLPATAVASPKSSDSTPYPWQQNNSSGGRRSVTHPPVPVREPLFIPYSSSRRPHSFHSHSGQDSELAELRKELQNEVRNAKEELQDELRSGLAELRSLVLALQRAQPESSETPVIESEDLHLLSLPQDI